MNEFQECLMILFISIIGFLFVANIYANENTSEYETISFYAMTFKYLKGFAL